MTRKYLRYCKMASKMSDNDIEKYIYKDQQHLSIDPRTSTVGVSCLDNVPTTYTQSNPKAIINKTW